METREQDGVGRRVARRLEQLTPSADWNPSLAGNRVRLRERIGTHRRHRRLGLMTMVAAAVLLLAAANVSVVRAVAQRCGEWLGVVSSSRPRLPEVTFTDAQGRPVSVSALRGKVVLLTFWTTTCGQCQTEMSWFADFQHTYRDRNLVVLGVSLDEGGWPRVSPFLEQRPINYDVVLARREATQPIVGASIPTTLIVDRRGRIAVRHIGYCSKGQYQRDLEKVLAE
jgi:peroxiredoxin